MWQSWIVFAAAQPLTRMSPFRNLLEPFRSLLAPGDLGIERHIDSQTGPEDFENRNLPFCGSRRADSWYINRREARW